MPRNPNRVVLPDGLIHVVCIVVNGQLMDPIVCTDALDAEARSNEVVVSYNSMPGKKPDVIIGTYKVRVIAPAPEVRYAVDA